jgi:hypothetical protein
MYLYIDAAVGWFLLGVVFATVFWFGLVVIITRSRRKVPTGKD